MCSWTVEQRLLSLKMFDDTFDAAKLASLLQRDISKNLPDFDRVTAIMHDSVAVIIAAMKFIHQTMVNAVDIICLSHTLDHVGDHMDALLLNKVVSALLTMFGQSKPSRAIWSEVFGNAPRSVSNTRWWSKWEFICDVGKNFGSFSKFVTLLEERRCCPSHANVLKTAMQNDRMELLIELGCCIDFYDPFVRATYHLEGDAFLLPFAFDEISQLCERSAEMQLPSVNAILGKVVEEEKREALRQRSISCISPSVQYFHSRISGDCSAAIAVSMVARLFNPLHVVYTPLEQLDKDLSKCGACFPGISREVLEGMQRELPTYVARARPFHEQFGARENPSWSDRVESCWVWWRNQRVDLPNFIKSILVVATVQASSGAAERVFSILRRVFDENQESAKGDYVEGACMLEYNYRNKRVRRK